LLLFPKVRIGGQYWAGGGPQKSERRTAPEGAFSGGPPCRKSEKLWFDPSDEIGDRCGECHALSGLGVAYATLGESRKAIGFYEQALAIQREIGDRRGESSVLSNLGIVYKHLDEPRKAIELYGQALVIKREIGDQRGEGIDLFNSAVLLDQMGNRAQAIDRGEAALKILESIEDPNAAKARALLEMWQGKKTK